MNPLVSIIVPIFNVEEYIKECILSILSQTYTNLDVVLVDDGSTDKSGEICDEFARQDARVHVIHQKNRGLVAARKTGLNEAKGEYIGFVDGDDYIAEDMYMVMVNNILNTKADFVHTGYIKKYTKTSSVYIPFKENVLNIEQKNAVKTLESFFLLSQKENTISPSIWSKLFRADFIKEQYRRVDDTQSYGEDIICLFWCMLGAKTISLLPQALYFYNVREDSMSHKTGMNTVIQKSLLYCHLERVLKHYNCLEDVRESLQSLFKNSIYNELEKMTAGRIKHIRYYYSEMKELYDKKIVLYGAGDVGNSYYMDIAKYERCRIISWVDKNYSKIDNEYYRICSPEVIPSLEYDVVLIAVKDEGVALAIKKNLIEIGVDEEKIRWQVPNEV